ncbi:hypothetical protein [Sphingobium sp. CCH11-B1]|jgi:hypothetical protein|uniref:hypothetical protein n=1 Tax=Sphingobium sp. CCH11-B1 TaxID=1768781 RepID=UPI00082A6FB6|nr:hypothetical protein [Sphingobium sp. CCH11-B1]MEA3387941.1 hypothetical protein [Pseudomonadota bacterium]
MADAEPDELTRPQKRFLKRLYNGRTVPVLVDQRPFLTYRDATCFLLALPPDAREAAYTAMKAQEKEDRR